ncbi:hormogonium polysaccharide secretion pseudopilin HpsC [Okeania sp. SIO2B3]|uniref:hormogonium polysaccharide secretion pseudopilin HpsC n=1 Tax=Okeania sp. SIO2B3 TaxID=2607784 RepID=UPI0013C10DC4|nr:hormogonium polysaccharide secretion pseudopilin HpsC [Okeania sp. SIO2B3]NET46485.1 prepilin-type cleavage/methylation domain-containing protein [Okeania sp. SIO2B3]
MKILLNLLLKINLDKRLPKSAQNISGFTMIELLVGTIIAVLLITPLLGFVVDILNTDVKETVKTNTEQELQAAVDYIEQDLSQAIYIYDQAGINSIEDQLPYNEDTTRTPTLVFWKRERVENSVPVVGCTPLSDEEKCWDDAYVMSLVAYYLMEDQKDAWCQPSGDNCPGRIGRFSIRDEVKKFDGTWVCDGTPSPCTTEQQSQFAKSEGFDNFDPDDLTAWEKDGDYDANNTPEVLLNYIDEFQLQSVTANNEDETDTSPSTTSNNLATITIKGNALRRLEKDANCGTDPSPFCPTATLQVRGGSKYGQ